MNELLYIIGTIFVALLAIEVVDIVSFVLHFSFVFSHRLHRRETLIAFLE